MKKFEYNSMGTLWEVTIWDQISEEIFEELKNLIIKMSEDFDKTYSRFKKDSLVWQISKIKGKYEVPPDFIAMLKIYFDLYLPSDKKLNPLIGFTISDLGYDADYSLSPKETIRPTPDLFESVSILDERQIEIREEVLFDFGALGKGYAVDKIRDILKKKGVKKFLVNGSGDIYYQGQDKIKVGLEDPDDPTKVIATVKMQQGAMCASGINRRKWRDLHHVIDPQISSSSKGKIVSSWVTSDNTAIADALASCLFFVEPETLRDFKFEYCILDERRQAKFSTGFGAKFFP